MADVESLFLRALESLEESPQFCVAGSLAPVLPGLEVQGVGPVGLPVSPAAARQLIEHAAQAPYGRGEETIVDPNVRRVWQLEPKQFSLHNPDWDPFLAGIVQAVKTEFGISGEVKYVLYKLLVYEKGSFFAPHRDTEKQDGMFATLVVCLPSRHTGGTLLVEHDRQTKEIDFGGPQGDYQVQYAAFYTDCRHEIQPVTEGYRVCLVYNLSLARVKQQPSAPQNTEKIEQVAALLPKLFAGSAPAVDDEEEDEDEGPRDKIAVPLKHEYTEAGLSRDLLKGEDRWCVDLLLQAAGRLQYHLFLALMTYRQTGDTEYVGYSPRSRWDYDEDDSDEEEDDSGAEMGEVYEEELTLDHWVDAQGRKQAFGQMNLEKNEIISELDFEDFPFKQTVHEATGNEGVTLERWYHQAVVVLWPPERYFRILARQGQASAVPALAELIAGTKDPAGSAECRAFAGEVIGNWRSSRYHGTDAAQSVALAELLEKLADPGLVNRFITEVLPRERTGEEAQALSRTAGKLGWGTFAESLTRFVAGQLPTDDNGSLAATAQLVAGLCVGPGKMTADRKKVGKALLTQLERTVTAWDAHRDAPYSYREPESREGVVEAVVRAAAAVEEGELLERFLTAALADKKHYDLHAVLIPVVRKMRAWKDKGDLAARARQRLVAHCIGQLEALTAKPVEVPTDWAQDYTLGCKCADCRELQKFMRDPSAQVRRFPLAESRRKHLHQVIDGHGCDMTHVTERVGRPYTLVCTKNRASYDRKKAQFAANLQLLAELREMATAKPKRRK